MDPSTSLTVKARDRGKGCLISKQPKTRSRLRAEEEENIIRFTSSLDSFGISWRRYTIESAANYFLSARNIKQPVSSIFSRRFVDRHWKKIRLPEESTKEIDRVRAGDPAVLENWYDEYGKMLRRHSIQPQDLYCFDETTFRFEIESNTHVDVYAAGRQGFPSTRKTFDGDLITVGECVNATGDIIPPFFVLKESIDLEEDWHRAATISNTSLVRVSPTATINDDLALDWVQHFDKYSAPRQVGKYRLLLLDARRYHYAYSFLNFCLRHLIIPVSLQPYTVGFTQPLYSTSFDAYKHFKGSVFSSFHGDGISVVTKVDVINTVEGVRRQILKSSVIKSAFKKTGLWPLDSKTVLERLPFVSVPELSSSTESDKEPGKEPNMDPNIDSKMDPDMDPDMDPNMDPNMVPSTEPNTALNIGLNESNKSGELNEPNKSNQADPEPDSANTKPHPS